MLSSAVQNDISAKTIHIYNNPLVNILTGRGEIIQMNSNEGEECSKDACSK